MLKVGFGWKDSSRLLFMFCFGSQHGAYGYLDLFLLLMHLNNTLHCRLLFTCLRKEKKIELKKLKKIFPLLIEGERLLCFLKLFIFSSFFGGSGFIAYDCKYNEVILTIIFSLLDALLVWERGCTTSVSLCDLFLTLNEIQRAKYVIFYFSCEFDLTLQLLGLIS